MPTMPQLGKFIVLDFLSAIAPAAATTAEILRSTNMFTGCNTAIEELTKVGHIAVLPSKNSNYKPLQITASGRRHLVVLEHKLIGVPDYQQKWLDEHRYRPNGCQLVELIAQLPPTSELLRSLHSHLNGQQLPLALKTVLGKTVTFQTLGLSSQPGEITVDAKLLAVSGPRLRHTPVSEHLLSMSVLLEEGSTQWEDGDKLVASLAFSRII